MTARQPPRPDGLNRAGNGKGLKKVTAPTTKKRGASIDRTKPLADNRAKYTNLALVGAANIADHVDPNKPLTDKAKLFVKFWAQGESITAASARAGYGDGATYAYRVSKFPQAVALYQEEKRLYEEASQMTRKRVMDGLLDGIEMAKLAGEPASVISGWREIGKLCGYYEPRKVSVDVNVHNATLQQMNRLSDAELLRVIQQGVSDDLERLEHNEN